MKTGRNLVELATELERRATAKRDFVVATDKIDVVQMPEKPGKVGLHFGPVEAEINPIALRQIADHAGIPVKYAERMLAEEPRLLANNIETWFRRYPTKRLVRTLDGRSRAFLSDAYRPLENEDLAEAVLPVLHSLDVQILSCDVTDRSLYIKAVDAKITKDVPKGHAIGDGSHVFFDTLSPAIVIRNSEVGLGPVSVETSIFTKMCTNLAVVEKSLRKLHLGGRHEMDNEVFTMLSDQTRKLDDAALWAKVRDIVKGAFEAARFNTLVDTKILGMAEQKIEGDPIKTVDLSARRFGLNEEEKKSVLRHLIEGGDLSRYGLFNAVTRTAEDIESYDRASEFERLGGEIVELAPSDWKVLATAA